MSKCQNVKFNKINKITSALFGLALLNLSACSTIISGSHQSLTINSQPTSAQCDVMRGGETLAHIDSTPQTIRVKRNGEDILIKCTKDGYNLGNTTVESDLNGWLFGNILGGGILGLVVDVSTGANHAYDDSANVVLTPQPTPYSDTLKPNITPKEQPKHYMPTTNNKNKSTATKSQ